ncbi:hypothetical protein IT084_02740 [Desulfallas sp. Bu1-1]|uniref:GDSL-type esterase/lipase family protein n=1 Tax=Desulfallas sp. Bu1-1 TaxID=2787620 RepID=UPI00189CFECB|nr:GDSL-type esterase/lipase family protein [Desulfallas sp. Bu1-1]MBF7081891.1 hypothetical protein [Desulfallas sp. Bu1-1]
MTCVIICLGDSITYGYPFGPRFSWVNLLQQKTGFNLINMGINGDTNHNLLRRFKNDVISIAATHVHILGGINDAWLELDLAASQNCVREMISLSFNHGILPVIGLTTPICANPSGGACFFPYGLDKVKGWLARYREWLREYTSVHDIPLIDYQTPLCLPETDEGNPRFFHDECHLNEKGYSLMASVAENALKTLLT